MAQIIYTKYSNERSRAFAVRTEILRQGDAYQVKKTALSPEGKAHVAGLVRWYQELSSLYQGAGWTCNRCMAAEDGVLLEYVEGPTLEEELDRLLMAGEVQAAEQRLCWYLDQLKRIHSQVPFRWTEAFGKVFGDAKGLEHFFCSPVTNVDVVCANLILNETPVVLDYEWTFDFPIPGTFVLYRVIHYYLDTHVSRKVLPSQKIFERYGITGEDKETFRKMEASLQKYIIGAYMPVRDQHPQITPGSRSLDQILCEAAEKEVLSVRIREQEELLHTVETLRVRVQAQEELLQEMKNTKIWKVYQRYRNFVEKKNV
jgi:hypothetical protein